MKKLLELINGSFVGAKSHPPARSPQKRRWGTMTETSRGVGVSPPHTRTRHSSTSAIGGRGFGRVSPGTQHRRADRRSSASPGLGGFR